MKSIAFLFIVTIALGSCSDLSSIRSESQNSEPSLTAADDYSAMGLSEQEASGAYQARQDNLSTPVRRVMYTTSTRFQVENLKEAHNQLSQTVEKFSGYISRMDESNYSYEYLKRYTIRIPQEKYQSFLSQAESMSMFTDYQRMHAQDVTEEFIDIEKRLASKRLLRDRYEEILRTQAKSLKELLEAERAILQVQEEIEAKEGRLNYLKNQVSMATIEVEMYEKVEYVETPASFETPFLSKVKSSLLKGWEVVQGICLIILSLWPFVLVVLGIYLMRKRLFPLKRMAS